MEGKRQISLSAIGKDNRRCQQNVNLQCGAVYIMFRYLTVNNQLISEYNKRFQVQGSTTHVKYHKKGDCEKNVTFSITGAFKF